jgi:hypothetical protein
VIILSVQNREVRLMPAQPRSAIHLCCQVCHFISQAYVSPAQVTNSSVLPDLSIHRVPVPVPVSECLKTVTQNQ